MFLVITSLTQNWVNKDLNLYQHDIRFEYFWLNFEMKTSWHSTRISRFRQNSFDERIPHVKVPFNFDFHLSNTISTWDTSLSPFSSQFWVDDVCTLSQNFKFWKNGFIKEEFTSKYPPLWFSSLYQHWYMKYQLGHFWSNVGLMTSSRESKNDLKSSIKYWFWSFYHPRYMI